MKTTVLFLCTGNSARSQMAEGYLRHAAGERFQAVSAGIAPKGLHPLAVEAMGEIGVDISAQRSKDVREFLGQAIAVVVTVCDHAREHCPVFPAAHRQVHWSFEDPAAARGSHEEQLAVFRRVRDQIRRAIEQEFLAPGK